VKRVIAVCALGLAGLPLALWLASTDDKAQTGSDPAPPVQRLPDASLPDLEDRMRSISEWSGRPLIINFWATWCAPCRREMPLLQSAQDSQSEGGLQIIGIALDTRKDAKRFVTENGIRYPVLYGEHEGAVFAESFGDAFVALPFSVFVAPDGQVVAQKSGELQPEELRRLIVQLDGRTQE